MWLTLGHKPDELKDPEVPEAGEFLYQAFWELWARDTGITYQAIYYYQLIYDIEFSGSDINILRILSAHANNWIAKREKAENKPKTTPSPTNRSGHAPRQRRGR